MPEESVEDKEELTLENMPDWCLYYVEATDKVVKINKGQDGYEDMGNAGVDFPGMEDEQLKEYRRDYVDHFNEKLGISQETARAMVECSMFGWPMPKKIVVNLLPNIKTQEQADRLDKLREEKEEAAWSIVRFISEYQRAIEYALELAKKHADDPDEFCEDVYEDDQGNEMNMQGMLNHLIREWKRANDRFTYYAARGEDR